MSRLSMNLSVAIVLRIARRAQTHKHSAARIIQHNGRAHIRIHDIEPHISHQSLATAGDVLILDGFR